MPISYTPIGRAQHGGGHFLDIDPAFRAGLTGLDGFGFITVLWHADQAGPLAESDLVIAPPYRKAPERLGVFATRSPLRPNPVCITVAALLGADSASGRVQLAWIDCEDGTPILDIKPYHPSADRVECPNVPDWCAGWPHSLEASGTFDWGSVFTG